MKVYRRWGFSMGFLAVFGLGLWLGSLRREPSAPAAEWRDPATRVSLQPGPWGELEYIPMSISAPAESLPIRSMEASKIHWFFSGFSREDFGRLVETLELPPAQQAALQSEEALHALPHGLDLTPPDEIFFSLPQEARLKIFQRLALYRENDTQLTYVSTASLDERFASSGISGKTADLFRSLSCAYGDYRVFSGFGPLLSAIPSYEEKVHLVQALTRQNSLLLRVHIVPETKVNELAAYWGKACWNTDVAAMLQSLTKVPGGSWLDVMELLPPFPTSLLYTFPLADNPLNGPVQRRDCHWTSFNFFRDPPDMHFSDPAYVMERLRLDYFPVTGDPRYGDVVLFSKGDGTIIHSAVYLADDILYTKNGDTPIHPWMLSTMKAVLEQYSFLGLGGEGLKVAYYRNKYY